MANFSRFWTRNVLLPSQLENFCAPAEMRGCPFCGSRNIGCWTGPTIYLTCGHCGADGPQISGSRHDDRGSLIVQAIAAWNFRPPL